VDLGAWARGEADHTFDELKRAAQEFVFNEYIYPEAERIMDARVGSLNDAHDVLLFCLKEKLVDPVEVDVDVDADA
jgi:hypothetical protein